MQEMKDYNQYSGRGDDLVPPPRGGAGPGASPRGPGAAGNYPPEDYSEEDEMMYVTTL